MSSDNEVCLCPNGNSCVKPTFTFRPSRLDGSKGPEVPACKRCMPCFNACEGIVAGWRSQLKPKQPPEKKTGPTLTEAKATLLRIVRAASMPDHADVLKALSAAAVLLSVYNQKAGAGVKSIVDRASGKIKEQS